MLGSGPGIGVGVASQFASQNFDKIALLSRNETRLQQDAKSVIQAVEISKGSASKAIVKTYVADVSDVKSLEQVLLQVIKDLGKPEVVVYNAARLGRGKLFEASEESVDSDFRVRQTNNMNALTMLMATKPRPWVSTQQLAFSCPI